MQFEFKDQTYTFPATLTEITLGKRVAFFREYGKELEERSKAIEAITDTLEREAETAILNLDVAMKEFAHYTGIPLKAVMEEIDMNSLINIYSVDIAMLREQEQQISLQTEYEWQGKLWVISPPELQPDNKMTFNEFLHGKEIVRQLNKLGSGKWDALPYLCAIYLREKDEPFTEDLVKESGERLRLMNELPMDIALGVAFFLSGTLSIYMSTSAYSEEEEARESIQQNTLITGDG
jgi:hypothetical protein